jgi:glycosyltransferase involved in cell wall biosynthesis
MSIPDEPPLTGAVSEHPAARVVDPSTGPIGEDVALLLPADDVQDPELSIVIPALNEKLTITEFISWCRAGMRDAGIAGEILIVDSSTDETARLAVEAGARVLQTPKRGLGRAYKDAIPFIRGTYVLMGDADCTYDFRELKPFVARFQEGYEYVMGSRWKGSIEPGAMPKLHQYLGTPVTTWILNRLYGCRFTDIHCGMRGITRDALVRMDLDSESWEYASEMVIKTVHLGLRTSEVPVRFLKDVDGRFSHHKRAGWRSPWAAAWINLRSMFVYGSDFFLLKPGFALFLLGLVSTLPLSAGPITIGHVTFSLYWMLVGVTASIVGLQAFFLGVIAQVLFDYQGRARRRWLTLFSYTRSVVFAASIVAIGIACAVPLLVYYVGHHERLSLGAQTQDGLAVTGMLLAVIGASLFTFTLVLHATAIATRGSSSRSRHAS